MTSIDNPDYWKLLGLEPDSSQEKLKRAFRQEARKWHPDLNGNDFEAEERFKMVNEAYAVLSDPKKRLLWESENEVISEELFSSGFPSYEQYIDVVLGINNLSNRDKSYKNTEPEYNPDTVNELDEYFEEDNEDFEIILANK